MATLIDVALEAGVSKATASRVLNNTKGPITISPHTKAKVLAAAKKLNYSPNISARRLAAKKSYVIGAVIPSYTHFRGRIKSNILEGLGQTLGENGYSLQLVNAAAGKEVESHLQTLTVGKHVDGLVLWLPVKHSFCQFLLDEKVPHCHIQTFPSLEQCSAVHVDNQGGAYAASEYLIKKGHRQIGFIVDQDEMQGQMRLRGYREALAANGIPFDPTLIIEGRYRGSADIYNLDLEAFWDVIPRCTALFSTSDLLAIVASSILQKSGYEIGPFKESTVSPSKRLRSIVGFDGQDVGEFVHPPLSTVVQDGHALGRSAARKLLAQLNGEDTAGTEIIETSLVIRGSS